MQNPFGSTTASYICVLYTYMQKYRYILLVWLTLLCDDFYLQVIYNEVIMLKIKA